MLMMYRDHPEEFHIICENFDTLPFDNFQPWLGELGIGESNASVNFLCDYYSARSKYTDEWILHIFQRVAQENAKKYDKLIAIYKAEYNPIENYDRTEASTHTRTPDLSREVSSSASEESSGSSSTDTQRKQVKTIEDDAGTYKTTVNQSIAPEDSDTVHLQTQTETTPSGSSTQTETYTGDPDHSETTTGGERSTSGSSTETETGTETTEIESRIHGNIGIRSAQELAEQEMSLAAKLNIFRQIETDLAAKLFLQVW